MESLKELIESLKSVTVGDIVGMVSIIISCYLLLFVALIYG